MYKHSKKKKTDIYVVDKLRNREPILLNTDKHNKIMAEVDDMLMEKLRQKAIQWKHDYDADSCNETNTDDELEPKVQMKANLILHEEYCKKVMLNLWNLVITNLKLKRIAVHHYCYQHLFHHWKKLKLLLKKVTML